MADVTPPSRRSKPPDADASPRGFFADVPHKLDEAGLGPLFAQMPATIWTTDQHLRLTFVQGSLFHRIGVNPSAVLGRTLMDLLLDGREDHPLIHGHLAALAGCETSVRMEWAGEIYSARIAPLRDEQGEVVGCAGVNQITAWVPDNEGTLRESDVRLRRVIDSSMVGIVFTRENAIVDANDAFLELTGYSVEELTTGQIEWAALTPPDAQEAHVRAFDEMRREGRLRPIETEFLRKDGTVVSALVSGVRLSARSREAVGFLLDITDRKRTERRLRATLACAEVLIGGADGDALATWMAEVCRLFEWPGAALWRTAADGTLATPSALNVSATHTAAIAPFAAETARTRQVLPAESVAALVVPLTIEDACHGVLALVRPNGPAPDAELITVMQSVSTQAARFLHRIT